MTSVGSDASIGSLASHASDLCHPARGVLIGAHVSPAGGVFKAVERGTERGCRAIQIFNQNPRGWKPSTYADEHVAKFREAFDASEVDALLIHAVYLLNCASEDPEIRAKSLASLTASLRAGDALGASGVVLHPGSALKNGGSVPEAIARAGEVIAEALKESERCPLHLEDTAGAGGTLGRTFEELAALIDAAGGHDRLGLCLDSCHLLASGYDVRTPDSLAEVLEQADRTVGLDRLGSLHVNDSQHPLGANRDRHATLAEGELGRAGCATFLSEPRFDGLPCVLETGSQDGAITREDVELASTLRAEGQAARAA